MRNSRSGRPRMARHGLGSSPLCIGPERFRGHGSPLAPSVSPVTRTAFQSCLAAAVRGPERFLGRICSYGACPVNDWEDSPATVRKAMKMWGDSAHKLQDNSLHAKSGPRLTFLRDRDHTDPVASGAAL